MRSTRRTMTARGRGRARNAPLNAQANNDHCDVCTYGGRMMCCDGCPKAFHFTCLVPPLDVDNPPTGNWYCRECGTESSRQPQQRGRKGRRKFNLFKELKDKARTSNPTSFMLPEHIRNAFDGIFAGKHGEFRDSNKEKPVQLDKRGYPVEPDREKFTDSKGKQIRCYYCKLPPKHLKPVMSCDFCDQHWHFDCLTPPLTIAPPLHKKWMCPLHADHALPPMRRLRGEDVLPFMDNTAIELPPERRRVECDPEFYLNETLHRLPKKSVTLDWIGQLLKGVVVEENDEKLQMTVATEKMQSSSKEDKKREVPDKGKRKEFFRDNEALIREKGKGKEIAHDEGKVEEFISVKADEEYVQMAIAIELSRNEYDDKGESSGSNGDNYEDERQLQPEDYEVDESFISSTSSTNVRIQTESEENENFEKRSLIMGERVVKRPRQDNEIGAVLGNNDDEAVNNEENPLFLLVEAAFGGFVSIPIH
ncbi:18800_t:CDS:2 [Funneliformis geosporum]|uniref:10830_t:CDS:1 n=1 Tax=Funneliformis geosporum TaxID=1117311 RepID=A0A9W4WLZ7_9GLOM|nr:10830_t:CDS:2 [Funneliformis geosporum]CAI2186837.1 18800_t:CDS:2 [Funneliformis geosporum]